MRNCDALVIARFNALHPESMQYGNQAHKLHQMPGMLKHPFLQEGSKSYTILDKYASMLAACFPNYNLCLK